MGGFKFYVINTFVVFQKPGYQGPNVTFQF